MEQLNVYCDEHNERARRFVEHKLCTKAEARVLFETLSEHIKTWKEKPRKSQNTYYKQHLLPKVESIFSMQQQCNPQDFPAPEVLVQLVGFSPAPLLLTAEALQSARLILLYTNPDTKAEMEDLQGLLEERGFSEDCIQTVPMTRTEASNPAHIYRRIWDLVAGYDPASVALDVTGGKKSMVSGAYISGAVQDYALYYVDFEVYDPEASLPVPGTEFLSRLTNPYDIFSERERTQIRSLFRHHQYPAAAELLVRMVVQSKWHEEYIPQEEREQLVRMRDYARVYSCWDAFAYDRAKGIRRKTKLPEIEALTKLAEEKMPANIFDDDEYVLRAVVDRYVNAERCEATGREKDAIIRYVQVIEFLCQHKIHAIKRDNSVHFTDASLSPEVTSKAFEYAQWSVTTLLKFLIKGSDVTKYDLVFRKGRPFENKVVITLLLRYDGAWSETDDFAPFTLEAMIHLIDVRNQFVHKIRNTPETHGSWPEQYETAEAALDALACCFLKVFCRDYGNGFELESILNQHRFLSYADIENEARRAGSPERERVG